YQLHFTEMETVEVESYKQTLFQMGCERVDMVTAPAEFSIRGGITDIYPVTELNPIRIELVDDEVDSKRYFDADTQRSLDKMTSVTVGPATELLLRKEDMLRAKEALEKELAKTLKKMKASEHRETLLQAVSNDIEKLESGEL